MEKIELLELLNRTKSETIQFFDVPENKLDKTYGDGKWSVRQILHHLADAEYIFLGRLKKVIAEPRQVILAYNQDDWNHAFDYITEPLDGKKELYTICREMNYNVIEKYYEEYGNKEFIHHQAGLRTLKMEFEKVALHNQTHNEQVRRALLR
ncbi:MAG: DinB family protein [Ignavibacteriae bacterium]|nr:DinB family protein [Ignavibacteriota bacterium]